MSRTKEQLIHEFEMMKNVEADARDYYLKAAEDSIVTREEIRQKFRQIAQDEQKHVEMVEKIIHLINVSL